MKRLLLISNSTMHGCGYLDHVAVEIVDFLGSVRDIAFVPYAIQDRDAYTSRARARFQELGIALRSVHEAQEPTEAIWSARALFIGGGNTFRLLTDLYEHRLLEPIRARVEEGMPYIGSSAGSNVACVSIKTTNDMPIVQPPRFEALSLVPFNINPHYLDPNPLSPHMGETREERIREFHELNAESVVGLREGAWLRQEGHSLMLRGLRGARLFLRGQVPTEYATGSGLDFLLQGIA